MGGLVGFCQVPKSLITKRNWRKTRGFFSSLFPVCPCQPHSVSSLAPALVLFLAHRSQHCPHPAGLWGLPVPPLPGVAISPLIIPLRKTQKAGMLLPWLFFCFLQSFSLSLPAARDGDDFLWPPLEKGSASSWQRGCFLTEAGPCWQITAPLCGSVSPSVHRGSDALSDSSEGPMLGNAASDIARISTVLRIKRFLFLFCPGNNTRGIYK